jgi:hypothetical protein
VEAPAVKDHPEAMAILEEFGIRAVPANVMPRPGETRAIATLQRLCNTQGFDHARLVVQVLAESDNNRHPINENVLDAISMVLQGIAREYPALFEKETSRVFDFFDRVPIGALEMKYCRGMKGIVEQKPMLAGQIWERLVRTFGEPQGDLLDDRRGAA